MWNIVLLNSCHYKSDLTCIYYTCENYKCIFFIKLTPVVFFVPKDPDDAFYIVDLADVLLKHKKWVSLLPRVEPFYG